MAKPYRVDLRKITTEDTDNIILWRNSPRVRDNFIYRKDLTVNDHLNWLESQIKTGKSVQFIIEEADTKKAIGTTYLRDIDLQHFKAEYGIYIGEENALGKGYALEATEQILNYGFNELNLHKINLRVLADNENAIKVYEKSGFIKEGCFKDDVFLDGSFRDIVFMAIFRDKFNENGKYESNL